MKNKKIARVKLSKKNRAAVENVMYEMVINFGKKLWAINKRQEQFIGAFERWMSAMDGMAREVSKVSLNYQAIARDIQEIRAVVSDDLRLLRRDFLKMAKTKDSAPSRTTPTPPKQEAHKDR